MMTTPLSKALEHPILDVMNFLNEVAERFPNAISLASGRPWEESFNVLDWAKQIELFTQYLAQKYEKSPTDIEKMLGQYGKTNGIINELVVEHVKNDEGIHISTEQVVITSGAQEAMLICMMALLEPGKDVLLITDPTYIGITGLAQILGVDVAVVQCDEDGPCPEHLALQIQTISEQGKSAKALYLIPDFNNPLGTCITQQRRTELLRLCRSKNLKIIEDNPYGMFRYRGEKLPTIMSLDEGDCVIYIGTFSKTICPGLRIGYLLTGKPTEAAGGDNSLVAAMSKVKSFATVNTSQMAQAVVGGILLANNCSLKNQLSDALLHYAANLEVMLASLSNEFSQPRFKQIPVNWNRPEGGFFITLTLPFEFTEKQVFECARDFGVICVPMCFFSVQGQFKNQVRLSFSYTDSTRIQQGIKALADYICFLHNSRERS